MNFNLLDNEASIIYKWGNYYQTPIEYLVIDNPRNIEPISPSDNIKPLDQVINDYRNQGLNFNQIINKLPQYPIQDIVMYYYQININTQISDQDKINLLKQINNALITAGGVKINNFADYGSQYQQWRSKYNDKFVNDAEQLQNILNIQNAIFNYFNSYDLDNLQIVPIALTPVQYESITVNIKLDTNNKSGLEIFYGIQNSYNLPFARYIANINDVDNKDILDPNSTMYQTKIYTGLTIETQPRYSSIIKTSKSEARKNNMIYFTIWLGDPDKELPSKASEKSYLLGEYSVNNNIISIEIPYGQEDENNINRVVQYVQKGFNLPINSFNESKVSAKFFMIPYSDGNNQVGFDSDILNNIMGMIG